MLERIVTRDPGMLACLRRACRAAKAGFAIVIEGETGTGKEAIARLYHLVSPRRRGPFVARNVGAIPSGTFLSELFGNRKGAYTDAKEKHAGVCDDVDEGTLFLDEIGELDESEQVGMLRFLQEKRFHPVGGGPERPFGGLVICATNRDLWARVQEGKFRKDLYHRLAQQVICVPPLRERKGDLRLLVRHYMVEEARKHGLALRILGESAMRTLEAYPWPGNVRELINFVDDFLLNGDEAFEVLVRRAVASPPPPTERRVPLKDRIAQALKALEDCGGCVTHAAKKVRVSRRHFYRVVMPHAPPRPAKSRSKRTRRRSGPTRHFAGGADETATPP